MSTDKNKNIARQATKGSLYSISSSAITIVLGFVRTTVMLRLLLPTHYGVTTLALFYVNLASVLFRFGFDQALIHHKAVTESVRRTFFVMRMGATLMGLVSLALLVPVIGRFYPDQPSLTIVILAYIVIYALREFNLSQVTILSKNLAFRQISIADVVSSVAMTLVAPTLAWFGWGIWAIVAEQFTGIFVRLLIIQLIYRPWRPRWGWDREEAKWFWDYGKKAWSSSTLAFFLDRFDDWFTGTFLGGVALGFYSRAYEYANYPRRVISNPLLDVFFPTFAQLQEDRQKLSRAFFRATSLMVRSSGLFGVIFVLTAPEFIPWLLGDKWTPMIVTFQLMIVYVLLEPLSMAARNLLMATGYPQFVLKMRITQTVIFIPAVILLGNWLNIEGVALAADLMVLVGAVVLFWQTHQVVDYSARVLWLWPMVGVVITAVITLSLTAIWNALPIWGALFAKVAIMTVIYTFILWLTEREQLNIGRKMIWGIIGPMLKERQQRKNNVS